MAKFEKKKKSFWIPEKEFKELEHNIWSEIDNKENITGKTTPIKELNRKHRKFREEKDDLGFANIVCSGETIVILG
jgi:hypothetical protein